MKNIAIIPARFGSKRIPKKNVKLFCGLPMISYSIEAAKASGLFDRILVSTDSREIATIVQKYGAEVPFLRPQELSDDHVATVPVINHAIDFLQSSGYSFQNACCIYPCSPLLLIEDLKNSYDLMLEKNSYACTPVCEFTSATQRGFRIDGNNHLRWLHPEYKLTRTQDLEKTYHDIGSFYWATREQWLKGDLDNSEAFIIPNWRVVDIDNEEDWKRAEIIYKLIKS